VDVVRKFTKLKCRLMPYLYGAMMEAHEHGTPMMRPMMLEFPNDPACDMLDRQYMLGESLLVAPIFREDGTVAERYVYDPAGNILEKEIGGKVTKYAYDGANQLVSSTDPDGRVTEYAYDAAGRLVKEGTKTYRYGYLDKVLSVIDGRERCTFTYHVDGQLATATRTGGSRSRATETETFLWDGLALIRRGSTSYVNEPHPNGGCPVFSSADGVMFNDVLGTTLGADGADGYAAASLTAFGDPVPGGPRSRAADALFTGKPHVDGLGYAFLFRNYRPSLGKWLTADPLGYPDGWNHIAYGDNEPVAGVDFEGAYWVSFSFTIQKTCDSLFYLLGPGLPIGDVFEPGYYRINQTLLDVVAKLIADKVQGDVMQAGLGDFVEACLKAIAEEGIGRSALEPTNAECLDKAVRILEKVGRSQGEIDSVNVVSKEVYYVSYNAEQINNLVKVYSMSVIWLVHAKYWCE